MVRKDVVIVHLMYQRQVSGITSFLSVPLELRKNWITSRMVVGMARMVEEFRDLVLLLRQRYGVNNAQNYT